LPDRPAISASTVLGFLGDEAARVEREIADANAANRANTSR
jgi:hypothetical protein